MKICGLQDIRNIARDVIGVSSEFDSLGQESPKGGVGSPTGFARGAGREWALPVVEREMSAPETPHRSEGNKSPSRN